jgi:hypothetical protein
MKTQSSFIQGQQLILGTIRLLLCKMMILLTSLIMMEKQKSYGKLSKKGWAHMVIPL